MPKLLSLSPKRVMTILKRHGFLLDHTTGSHYVFYRPATKRRAVVPYHARNLPKGTLASILREAGLSRQDLD